jgi:hypothetical protein
MATEICRRNEERDLGAGTRRHRYQGDIGLRL